MARATTNAAVDENGDPIRALEISCDPDQVDPISGENICEDRVAATDSGPDIYRITLCPAFFDDAKVPPTSNIKCVANTPLGKYDCKGRYP